MGVFFAYEWYRERAAPKPPASGGSAAPSAPASSPPPKAISTTDASKIGPPAQPVPLQTRTFQTPLFAGTLSNQGAGLSALTLTGFAERVSTAEERVSGAQPPRLSLVSQEPAAAPCLQATLSFEAGGEATVPLQFVPAAAGAGAAAGTLTLTGQGTNIAVHLQITPRQDAYALDYSLDLHNIAGAALLVGAKVSLALSVEDQEDSGGLLSGKAPGSGLRALCNYDGSVAREDAAALAKKPFVARGDVHFAGLDRQYFVVTALPDAGGASSCTLSRIAKVVYATLDLGTDTVAAGSSWHKAFKLYAGPKLDEAFAPVSAALEETIEYNMWRLPLGALARPMVALLGTFHAWVGSWGLAIVFLTVLVKLLLLPLSYKGVMSMRKMQVLKPELDKIRGRFPNDRERQSAEQMKLYRDKGINPLGGCLPMLLQVPVGLALYRTLWSAVHLYHQPFLWLPDLTAKEPYPALAVLLGAVTVLQQKLTPMNMEASQAKIFTYVMPVMLTFLMVNLPSGLVVYILVNSILTILQQLVINRRAASLS